MPWKIVGFHEIRPGEKFVSGKHTDRVFPRDAHKHRQAGSSADKHCIKALFQELVDRFRLPDYIIGVDLHTHLHQPPDFVLDDLLGQAELGNAVHEDSSRQMQGLKNNDIMAPPGQVSRHRNPGRSRTHDSHPLPAGRRLDRVGNSTLLPRIIGRKTFESADGHWLAFLAENAFRLALAFLRAYSSANGWQSVLLLQLDQRIDIPVFGDEPNEGGDVYIDRAAFDTTRLLAVQAARSLEPGRLLGIPERYLLEIMTPAPRILFRHRLSRNLHPGGLFFCAGRLIGLYLAIVIHQKPLQYGLSVAVAGASRATRMFVMTFRSLNTLGHRFDFLPDIGSTA